MELCSICLEALTENKQIGTVKPCDHRFCLDCILQWINKATGLTQCPYCRGICSRVVYKDWMYIVTIFGTKAISEVLRMSLHSLPRGMTAYKAEIEKNAKQVMKWNYPDTQFNWEDFQWNYFFTIDEHERILKFYHAHQKCFEIRSNRRRRLALNGDKHNNSFP